MMLRHFVFKIFSYLILAFCAAGIGVSIARPSTDIGVIAASELPREAQKTLDLIRAGGPYPYPRDGVVFGNRERILPKQKRGYYHEYTVKTPGVRSRGARRIVSGREGEYYYSDDHYASFKRIVEKT